MQQATKRMLCFAVLAATGFACAPAPEAFAQASWDYSPYQLRAWVALEPSPRLNDAVLTRIQETVARRGKLIGGAAWNVRADRAPLAAASDILQYMDQLTDERLILADASDKDDTITIADKLYVVAVADRRFRFDVQVRELDMHTRVWGRIHTAEVFQQQMIPDVIMNLIAKAFLPVMRIESIDGKDMVARLRAAELIVGESICSIPPGAVMQPVVRRNNRLGQPLKGGILVAPWTVCQVMGYQKKNEAAADAAGSSDSSGAPPVDEAESAASDSPPENDVLAKLRLHAGKSNPLGVRKGVRTQRYAILIRPAGDSTTLLLKSDIIGDPEPLVGYDFYEKNPYDMSVPAKHVGKSDWRGAMKIDSNGKPFRLIYVRSGGKLMARMPVVPGNHAESIAFMRDDDRRLEAESYIRSIESQIMDQVVQRKLLTRNIDKRAFSQRLPEAEVMLEQFRKLRKQVEMTTDMDDRKIEIAPEDVDRRTKRLVDQLFTRAKRLVTEHVKPTDLQALEGRLKIAKELEEAVQKRDVNKINELLEKLQGRLNKKDLAALGSRIQGVITPGKN